MLNTNIYYMIGEELTQAFEEMEINTTKSVVFVTQSNKGGFQIVSRGYA